MQRRRLLNTLLVVLFVFRLVLAPRNQGYAATATELWDQCRQLDIPLAVRAGFARRPRLMSLVRNLSSLLHGGGPARPRGRFQYSNQANPPSDRVTLIAMTRLFTNHTEGGFRTEAGKPPMPTFRMRLRS